MRIIITERQLRRIVEEAPPIEFDSNDGINADSNGLYTKCDHCHGTGIEMGGSKCQKCDNSICERIQY